MRVDKIEFEVTTPERRVLVETVDELILPATDGYMGVRPGHAPLLTGLDAGEVSYRVGNEFRFIAVSAGFAEILRHRVSVLADTAERAEEIDAERARRSKERAEKALAAHDGNDQTKEAEARLRRAVARLQVREHVG